MIKNSEKIILFSHDLVEGETSWFVVKESCIRDNTGTITVSANGIQSVLEEGNVDQLLPGVCVEFQVTKVRYFKLFMIQ